jgi:hypothetical protein
MPDQVLPTPQGADAGLVQFEDNWPRATLARKFWPSARAACLAAPSRQQAQEKERATARAGIRAQGLKRRALFQPNAA